MSSDNCRNHLQLFGSLAVPALVAVFTASSGALTAQQVPAPSAIPGQQPVGPTPGSFQGSVTAGQSTGQVLDLSLNDAIERGIRNNLGVILSGTQTASAKAQKLTDLQPLLPDIEFNAVESVQQV